MKNFTSLDFSSNYLNGQPCFTDDRDRWETMIINSYNN